VPEPLVDLGHVLVLELTELELARVERRFSTAAPDTHSRGEHVRTDSGAGRKPRMCSRMPSGMASMLHPLPSAGGTAILLFFTRCILSSRWWAPTDAAEPRKKKRLEAVQSEQRRKADSDGGHHLNSPAAALAVISPETCGAWEKQKKFQAESAGLPVVSTGVRI